MRRAGRTPSVSGFATGIVYISRGIIPRIPTGDKTAAGLRKQKGFSRGRCARWYSLYPPSVHAPMVQKHSDACAADEHITHHAPHIRNLPEEYVSQSRGKQDLGIVINAYFLSRSEQICSGNAELTDAGAASGEQQHKELMSCQPHRAEEEKRQGHHRGKQGKIEHNPQAVFSSLPQFAHEGIRKTRSCAAEKACQGRKKGRALEAGLDDQYAA